MVAAIVTSALVNTDGENSKEWNEKIIKDTSEIQQVIVIQRDGQGLLPYPSLSESGDDIHRSICGSLKFYGLFYSTKCLLMP